MIKERFQELADFVKTESPYRLANKGWINEDIYLKLGENSEQDLRKGEVAQIYLLWSPINKLISSIFFIIIICSILVFSSVSFASGKFHLDFVNDSLFDKQSETSSLDDQNLTAGTNLLNQDIVDKNKILPDKKSALDEPFTINNELNEINSDPTKSLVAKKVSEPSDNPNSIIKSKKVTTKNKSNLF